MKRMKTRMIVGPKCLWCATYLRPTVHRPKKEGQPQPFGVQGNGFFCKTACVFAFAIYAAKEGFRVPEPEYDDGGFDA